MYPNKLKYSKVTWYISRSTMHKTKTINQNSMHETIKQRIQINLSYSTITMRTQRRGMSQSDWSAETKSWFSFRQKTDETSNSKRNANRLPIAGTTTLTTKNWWMAVIFYMQDLAIGLHQRFCKRTAHAPDQCTMTWMPSNEVWPPNYFKCVNTAPKKMIDIKIMRPMMSDERLRARTH